MIAQPLRNYPILSSFANLSAAGSNQLVGGVAGMRVVVISFRVLAANPVSVYFASGSTAITSTTAIGPGGFGSATDPYGQFATAEGQALNLNLSASVAVGVDFKYILAP